MRALLTIPHYYAPKPDAQHGSSKTDSSWRMRCLELCIGSLHETFGPFQGIYNYPTKQVRRSNRADAIELDIVVCTTGEQHLVPQMRINRRLFRHHASTTRPQWLGFECQEILRSNLGKYDYYGYLEDDIQVTDPMFFIKQDWFHKQAGSDALLQPNRFEASMATPVQKLYIDCNLIDPAISPRFQDRTDRPKLQYESFGRNFLFQRIDNPHSGCFFLNAGQMAQWAAKPYFGEKDDGFWGILESAATLGIMKTFRIYKPAKENAAFLEVRHVDNRYLANRIRFTAEMIEP